MDSLWRMAWALPLVLGIGLAAALVIRRFVVLAPPTPADGRRIRLQESLSLSADTCVHVIEVDRQAYLLVESSVQASLQVAAAKAEPAPNVPPHPGPTWARRLVSGSRA